MRHASASIGPNLVIWGGRDGLEYFNDLWMYNTLTFTWSEMPVFGDLRPIAAEGSCLVVNNEAKIFIFGGSSDAGAHNLVYEYN
jgi:N-acetylneuraminic acid mutarotase